MNLTTEYRPDFAQIAFEKLSRVPLRDENILCIVFRCSKQTLSLWKAEYPEFKNAVELGLLTGEYKFRELMFSLSLVPAKKVNTKLLTILASNVYRINEEQVQQIQTVAQNGDMSKIEQRLEQLGIPVPCFQTEDLPDLSE